MYVAAARIFSLKKKLPICYIPQYTLIMLSKRDIKDLFMFLFLDMFRQFTERERERERYDAFLHIILRFEDSVSGLTGCGT